MFKPGEKILAKSNEHTRRAYSSTFGAYRENFKVGQIYTVANSKIEGDSAWKSQMPYLLYLEEALTMQSLVHPADFVVANPFHSFILSIENEMR